MNKCGFNASRSDSGVISSSVSESALSDSGSKKSRSSNVSTASRLGDDGPNNNQNKQQQKAQHHPTEVIVTRPPRLRRRTSSEEAKRKEREARSIAIEKAYVHDVYESISSHVADNRYRAWPRVKEFIQDLEPGSIICDVGKINRIYTQIYPNLLKFTQNITEAEKKFIFEFLIFHLQLWRKIGHCNAAKKKIFSLFFFYMRLLLKLDFL